MRKASSGALKIVLVAAGPLFIALGLFWFGQAAGVLSGLHYAVLIDVGADVAAWAWVVRVAVAQD